MARSRPRAPRGSLDSEQIVDTAGALIASGGLDNFSMPALARQLEVGVSSIYWHFRSRDELLRAIAVRVTSEFYEGLEDDDGLEGEDRVLRQFRLYWRRLRDNPLWRDIFISSFAATVLSSPEGTRRAGAVVQAQVERMVEAGLDLSEATAAYRILSAYTRGSVVVMHRDRAGSLVEGEERRLSVADEMTNPTRSAWTDLPDDEDALFDVGLRALWAGLVAQSRAPHYDPLPEQLG